MIDKKVELEHWETEHTMNYHRKQFLEPKRSTVAFEEFLTQCRNIDNSNILDLACGGGAVELYLTKLHPKLKIHGVDIIDKSFRLLEEFTDISERQNITLTQGDWYNLSDGFIGKYDGVISLQSLSWLEDWKIPMEKVCRLNPDWIAMSSLFYEGRINYQVKLTDYEIPTEDRDYQETYYNIYSIPMIKEYLLEWGYTDFKYEPFNIDIDLEKPNHMDAQTYTIRTEDGKRMQISGAMLMPWYFIYASKSE